MLQIILKNDPMEFGEIRRNKKKCILRFIVFYSISFSELYNIIFILVFISFNGKYDFKNYIIGNLTDYYSVLINSTHTFVAEPECNNISFHYNCSNDNDLSGYKNDTNINNNNFIFRKLVSKSFCHEIYSSFIEYKGKPLSYIFDFNISRLFGISIPIFIISLLFFSFFNLLFARCKKIVNFFDNKIVKIFILFLYIAKFVLFIIFFYFFEEGDIGKYENFLECKYVRKKYFSKFPDVDKIIKAYKTYWISTIISESLDTFEMLLEIIIEEKNKNKNNDNASEVTITQNNSVTAIGNK